jgi:hypothetical protein
MAAYPLHAALYGRRGQPKRVGDHVRPQVRRHRQQQLDDLVELAALDTDPNC